MKLIKPKVSKTVPEANEYDRKNERIGRPMLFPIFFCLVSGVLLILLDDLTRTITGYVLAAVVIIWGFWQIFEYIRSDAMVRIIEAKLAIGLILVVTGSLIAFSPDSLRELFPYAWGLSLLFGGFLKIQYAFDRKALGSQRWWILLILAAVSLIIGIVTLLNPAFLGERKAMVIGILLTLEAVIDITVFILLKRKIRKSTLTLKEPVSAPAAVPAPAASSDPVAAPDPAEPEASEPAPPETDA